MAQPTPRRRRTLAVAIVALLISGGAGAVYLLVRTPPPPAPVTLPATLSIDPHHRLAVLSPGFWGINTRPQAAPSAAVTLAVQSSPVRYIRWPGGLVAERYNLTANVLTNDAGGVYGPPVNLSSFVSWCRQLGCHAIVQLPTEIASPATAAYEVAYAEHVIGFSPDYWELEIG